MKKILEFEALQAKVNNQIRTLGEANQADADMLEELGDSLSMSELGILGARYDRRRQQEVDREYDEHLNEIRRYK